MKRIDYIEGVFKSKWISKFINLCFFKGKKHYIEKIFYLSFYLLKKELNYCPFFIFFEVLEKIKPIIGLKIYRFGKGKTKKITVVPHILKIDLQYKKSIYWLVKSVKLRKEKNLWLRIYNEFYDVLFNKISNSLKKKKEHYKYVIMFKTIKKFKW
jgi:ribosomal protein S7